MIGKKTSVDGYENVCNLDVFGVTVIARDVIFCTSIFKDQLRRCKDGWCRAGLMWTDNSTSL